MFRFPTQSNRNVLPLQLALNLPLPPQPVYGAHPQPQPPQQLQHLGTNSRSTYVITSSHTLLFKALQRDSISAVGEQHPQQLLLPHPVLAVSSSLSLSLSLSSHYYLALFGGSLFGGTTTPSVTAGLGMSTAGANLTFGTTPTGGLFGGSTTTPSRPATGKSARKKGP